MSERSCETCKYQTRMDPCPRCWKQLGKPSWTAKRPSTLEVLRKLKDEVKAHQDYSEKVRGWYRSDGDQLGAERWCAYADMASIAMGLITAEIKRLEEPEQKP